MEEPISPSVIRNEREREEVLERQMEEWDIIAEEKLKKREEDRKRMYDAHQRKNGAPRKQVHWDLNSIEGGREQGGGEERLYDENVSVEEFLRALDLERYVEHFRTQEVDMELLRSLTLNELMQNLGLPWGPAKKIVSKLHPSPQSSDSLSFGGRWGHAPPVSPPSPLFRNRSFHEGDERAVRHHGERERAAAFNATRYNPNIGWLMGDEERARAGELHEGMGGGGGAGNYMAAPRWGYHGDT